MGKRFLKKQCDYAGGNFYMEIYVLALRSNLHILGSHLSLDLLSIPDIVIRHKVDNKPVKQISLKIIHYYCNELLTLRHIIKKLAVNITAVTGSNLS